MTPPLNATFIIINKTAKVTIKSHMISHSDTFQRTVDHAILQLKHYLQ